MKIADETTEQRVPLLHFRSVFTQVLLVSCVAFCTIGSFNALQGLGGAGQEKPYIANAATAINFGLMGIVCCLGGPIVHVLGVQKSLALGTVGDPLFGAAVYVNTRYGTQWFLIVAAVARGACTGLFWAAEGSVIIGYPRPQHRGKSITLWVAFKELGSIVSSSINLGLSAHDSKGGHIGYPVYYVTIAIMCCGFPLALLLSPTSRVRHRDGSSVKLQAVSGYEEAYRSLWEMLGRSETLLLLPFAWFAYFYYSYTHTFVAQHFSVRGRALVSLLTALSSVVGSVVVALLSDPRRVRAQVAVLTITVLSLCAGTWAYFAYISLQPKQETHVRLDWRDDGFGPSAVAPVLVFLAMQAAQSFLYWLAAAQASNVAETFLLAGLVRGTESLGQCVAYGLNSAYTKPLVSITINLVLMVVGSAFLIMRLYRVDNTKYGNSV